MYEPKKESGELLSADVQKMLIPSHVRNGALTSDHQINNLPNDGTTAPLQERHS